MRRSYRIVAIGGIHLKTMNDYMVLKLRLHGGPKDGHEEYLNKKLAELTLEYPTFCGRIAIYKERTEGEYYFIGYK